MLLYAKSEDNRCYVTTTNLDGETNFKAKFVPKCLPHFKTKKEIGNFNAVIEYEKPRNDLYDFNGKIINNKKE